MALIAAASCQENVPIGPPAPEEGSENTPYIPPQVPHHRPAGQTPVTVDAGKFAQVDVQPNGGPVRVRSKTFSSNLDVDFRNAEYLRPFKTIY